METPNALVRLLDDFIKEARIRKRRTNCPFEGAAAAQIEVRLSAMLEEAKGNQDQPEPPAPPNLPSK